MPNMRDFRVRVDLNFDPSKVIRARAFYALCKRQVEHADNINPGAPNQEIGYVSIHRCGHRRGEECTLIEKDEVP